MRFDGLQERRILVSTAPGLAQIFHICLAGAPRNIALTSTAYNERIEGPGTAAFQASHTATRIRSRRRAKGGADGGVEMGGGAGAASPPHHPAVVDEDDGTTH